MLTCCMSWMLVRTFPLAGGTEGPHAFLCYTQSSAVTLDASSYPSSIVGVHVEE